MIVTSHYMWKNSPNHIVIKITPYAHHNFVTKNRKSLVAKHLFPTFKKILTNEVPSSDRREGMAALESSREAVFGSQHRDTSHCMDHGYILMYDRSGIQTASNTVALVEASAVLISLYWYIFLPWLWTESLQVESQIRTSVTPALQYCEL